MALKKVNKKIEKLRQQIRNADYHYYVLSNPQISDKEYDELLKELEKLEKSHPRLITPDSPTQRVSGKLIDKFPAVDHKIKMLSLDNTYSTEELIEWENRMHRTLGKKVNLNYMAELKIDGISCSLTYQKGILTRGLTRGDGQRGEDVTPNLKTIASIPLKLREGFPEIIEIRGEVYIEKDAFKKLNKQRLKNGKAPFANPRNAAAGSLKLLDLGLTAKRELGCLIHSFGWVQGCQLQTQSEFLEKIQSWGLPVQKENKFCQDLSQVIRYCSHYQKNRQTLPYENDGVVVKINSLNLQKKLGCTSKSPRWAVAYKFPAIRKTTQIKEIDFSVGRTGIITPVAFLKPVECGGAKIKKATLHNFDQIQRLGLKINDTVLIERAGDVIPKIVKVINSRRNGKEKEIIFPQKCPACKNPLNKEDVYYFCLNPNCPSQLKRSLIHFACRGAMDIEGMGESLVEELIKRKLVKKIPDIYSLTKKQLSSLPLFKEKKANNLLAALEKSKNRPLSRLLFGLGIPQVGQKAATTLTQQFESLDKVAALTEEKLKEINEIGPVIAKSVVKFFRQKAVQETIRELKAAKVNTLSRKQKKENKLAGKIFVFTGQLKHFSRGQAQKKVEELGAKWSSSISKKTDYLVAGKNPGSKYKKAAEEKVNILDEPGFMILINSGG